MNPEDHARARQLIDALYVEGIPPAEREWLEAHLADCTVCQARAHSTEEALQVVRTTAVGVSPELVGLTQARVHARACGLREERARMQALWISCTLSWLLGAISAPLIWQAIAWLGRRFEVSQAIWIVGFALCWLAPATVLGTVVAWRYSRAAGQGSGTERQ
jgi:hypothetical protein